MTENLTDNIINLTLDNAQKIIDKSNEQLVIIDFWADWCEPCKKLMPVLEKLAREYAGQLILAKVNVDDQRMLAEQFRVRSLPTVMVIKEGQPVDGFSGAQTESQVRTLLQEYLPDPWNSLVQQAEELQEQGQHRQALPLLRKAYTDSGEQTDIAKLLTLSLIELNRCDEAQDLLDSIENVDRDAYYQRLVSQLELKQNAALSPELDDLEKRWRQAPDNEAIGCEFAVKLSQQNRHKQGLDILMELLQRDINAGEGKVKKALLDIIHSLDKDDPLAADYQRKLFTLLY